MMDNDKALRSNKLQRAFSTGALHVKGLYNSVVLREDGETTRYDPETAHTGSGDPGFEKSLPDVCGLCRATQLATQAASKIKEAD